MNNKIYIYNIILLLSLLLLLLLFIQKSRSTATTPPIPYTITLTVTLKIKMLCRTLQFTNSLISPLFKGNKNNIMFLQYLWLEYSIAITWMYLCAGMWTAGYYASWICQHFADTPAWETVSLCYMPLWISNAFSRCHCIEWRHQGIHLITITWICLVMHHDLHNLHLHPVQQAMPNISIINWIRRLFIKIISTYWILNIPKHILWISREGRVWDCSFSNLCSICEERIRRTKGGKFLKCLSEQYFI